ncbi:MAG: single-stranded-DNA-specific exonuclease RecJ [Thermoanaerobaculia bacterium]|nr:single-stranded-DNA-specific exonuclease RecJ [Thermoanaerobaculia bacterium]
MTRLRHFPGLVQMREDGGLLSSSLALQLAIPRAVGRVLWARGFRELLECRGHLQPEIGALHAPEEMAGISRAVEQLAATADRGGRVVVFGDYDCDGVGAVAILTTVLRRLGVDARPFIPHRLRNGYGLRLETLTAAVEEHRPEGIVTVDCGITSRDPVTAAVGQGIYVIVTDHHLPPEDLPLEAILIDPKLPGCGYPYKELCGAGIALKLGEALLRHLGPARGIGPEQRQNWVLSLSRIAAISTIADMVPLTGENRIIVALGLEGLRNPRSPGLAALLEACQVPRGRAPNPREVAFRLAPRLNAAGRMDHAFAALDLLLTTDESEARTIAGRLEQANDERRRTTERVVASVRERLARHFDPEAESVIVEAGFADEGWHRGVLGVAASKIAAEFQRPAVLLAQNGEVLSGSGRTYGRTPLYSRIKAVAEGHALHFGGHTNAVGITLPLERFEEFRTAVRASFDKERDPDEWRTEITVDTSLELEEVGEELLSALDRLEPHGLGNPEPVFLLEGLEWDGRARRLGENGLRFEFSRSGQRIGAIGWTLARRAREERTGSFDVVAAVQRDSLTRRPSLRVIEIAPAAP